MYEEDMNCITDNQWCAPEFSICVFVCVNVCGGEVK